MGFLVLMRRRPVFALRTALAIPFMVVALLILPAVVRDRVVKAIRET